MNLRSLHAKLRKPLPPGAVTPNVDRPGFSSIKSIYVTERLNEVFGENGWFATYEVVERGAMVVVRCELTVPRYDIRRVAFGGNSNDDRGDSFKGACSDALGKAASQIGIGVEVYKGMADRAPNAKNGERIHRKKEQYAVIDGIVNRYELLSPQTLFLKVDQTPVRAISEHIIKELASCSGNRVELRCRWDVVNYRKRKESVWTVLNVLGNWRPGKRSK